MDGKWKTLEVSVGTPVPSRVISGRRSEIGGRKSGEEPRRGGLFVDEIHKTIISSSVGAACSEVR